MPDNELFQPLMDIFLAAGKSTAFEIFRTAANRLYREGFTLPSKDSVDLKAYAAAFNALSNTEVTVMALSMKECLGNPGILKQHRLGQISWPVMRQPEIDDHVASAIDDLVAVICDMSHSQLPYAIGEDDDNASLSHQPMLTGLAYALYTDTDVEAWCTLIELQNNALFLGVTKSNTLIVLAA